MPHLISDSIAGRTSALRPALSSGQPEIADLNPPESPIEAGMRLAEQDWPS